MAVESQTVYCLEMSTSFYLVSHLPLQFFFFFILCSQFCKLHFCYQKQNSRQLSNPLLSHKQEFWAMYWHNSHHLATNWLTLLTSWSRHTSCLFKFSWQQASVSCQSTERPEVTFGALAKMEQQGRIRGGGSQDNMSQEVCATLVYSSVKLGWEFSWFELIRL